MAEARPWPGYETDYKPLVDFAREQDWPVVAASPPRATAADVARGGLGVLASRSEAEAAWVATDVRCETDDPYFRRFVGAMRRHELVSPVTGPTPQDLEHYYSAQCLKDETMAESIAQALVAGSTGGRRPLVVHVNGTFHSDFGGGVVERTLRRLPDRRVVVLAILPVRGLDRPAPDVNASRRADNLIYTLGRGRTGSGS